MRFITRSITRSITLKFIASTALLACSGIAFSHDGQTHPSAADTVMGEVRKIDTENQKITLKHAPIKNLDMPAMTMVFRITEPKQLNGLKPGDAVAFTADTVDDILTVITIKAAAAK